MGRTKDESFMIRLYEEAVKHPTMDEPMDRYVIGQAVGLQKKAVDTICNTLLQTNFVRKQGDVNISITPNGIELVERLKGMRR